MKTKFAALPLALAIAGLCVTSVANAGDYGKYGKKRWGHHGKDFNKDVADVPVKGHVHVHGRLWVDSVGGAVIDEGDSQRVNGNNITQYHVDNNGIIKKNYMQNASGNIGVNNAAGDANAQGNSAAIAAADASIVFGLLESNIEFSQNVRNNMVDSDGVINNAVMQGNSLMGAMGNVGVNNAAGSVNAQKNTLALTTGHGGIAEATVSVSQNVTGNTINTSASVEKVGTKTRISMDGAMYGYYAGYGKGKYEGREYGRLGFKERGNMEGSYYGKTQEKYSGRTSERYAGHESGKWSTGKGCKTRCGYGYGKGLSGTYKGKESGRTRGSEHGRTWGSEYGYTEGSYYGSGKGKYAGKERGRLAFKEAGVQALYGSFSGEVEHFQKLYVRAENNAILTGNSMQNVKGNIGVNNAAGNGNAQNNNLAIARNRAN